MRNANRSVKTKAAVCEKAGFSPTSYKHVFSSCTYMLWGKRKKKKKKELAYGCK